MRPDGVVASDPAVQLFYRILASAYADISRELLTVTGSTAARRRAQKQQIEQIIARAEKDVQDWIKVEIPAFYEQGLFDTMSDLHDRGDNQNITMGYAKFHREAIEAIAQDAWASASQGLASVSRSASQILSAAAKAEVIENLAKGVIKGDSLTKIKKAVADTLQRQGLTAIVDRSGRSWDLLRYSEMLARTKLTQAHNSGVANRMVESGYDLVIVSQHFGACPLCTPWEARVLSVTSRNSSYTSLDEAIGAGLFHPNCKHVVSPYHEKFLDVSVAWDTTSQSYRPFRDVQSSVIEKNKTEYSEKLKKIGYNEASKQAQKEAGAWKAANDE